MDNCPSFSALDQRLRALSDEKYRIFNESLIPGSQGSTFGVRLPALRQIARELCKEDWRGFLINAPDEIHEYVLLQALVAAMAPCAIGEKLEHVAAVVPKISNWAQCDALCSAFKDADKHRALVYDFLQPYLSGRAVYQLRFGVVMLLGHFRKDAYIDAVLLHLERAADHEDYYVRMAVAWALSFCFVSHRDKTLRLLEQRMLPPWVQNKTIQKCRESFRVSDEDKGMLLGLKLKES